MNLVIAAVILIWLLYRQLTERPVKERSLLGWIVLACGVFQVSRFASLGSVTSWDIVVLLGSALLGCALATLRASTVRLRRKDGQLMQQGTVITAALWIVGLGQHLFSELLMPTPALAQATLLAYFGLVILVQRGVLLGRARAAEHLSARSV